MKSTWFSKFWRIAWIFILTIGLLVPTFSIRAAQEDYKHWSDKPAGSGTWQNGALQSTNSNYSEGEVVPHYWKSQGLTVGTNYGFYIVYDYYDPNANTCGFDYLTAYDISRVTTFVDQTPAADMTATLEGGGYIYSAGADILTIGAPIAGPGVNQRQVPVTFTATTNKAEFYWGLHLSLDNAVSGCLGSRDWSGASLQTDVNDTPVISGVTMLGGGGTLQINPSAILASNFAGVKFNDINGNAARDVGEPLLSNWLIVLYRCTVPDCSTRFIVSTDFTDANGNYEFSGLITGSTYQVCEVLQTGWEQTYPTTNGGCSAPVTITVGGTTTVQDFGNRQADVQLAKSCPADLYGAPEYYYDVPGYGQVGIYEFTITVTNNGSAVAKNVYFTDDFTTAALNPPGVTTHYFGYVADPLHPPDNCSINFGVVTCTLGEDLAPGAVWTIGLNFYVTFADPNNTEANITNSATVSNSVIDPNLANNTDTCSITTPVTLASFQASLVDGRVRFDWNTAAEINNAGFNLYVQQGNELLKLNPRLIPSRVGASVDPQSYSVELPAAVDGTFYLEDVDIRGVKTLHGPYQVGQGYGNSTLPFAIDWAAVGSEHTAKAEQRLVERFSTAGVSLENEVSSAAVAPAWTAATAKAYLPLAMSKSNRQNFAVYELSVKQDGLYRVTYEALKAQGLDLAGVQPTAISLSSQGQAVPLYVQSSGNFGPGAYFEFVGKGLDTQYTDTNVYQLKVYQGDGLAAGSDSTAPGAGVPAAYYLETARVHKNLLYNYSSPNGDPWVDTMMSTYGGPYSGNFTINVDNFVPSGPAPTLTVNTWGYGDNIIGDDHHLLVSLNNTQLADAYFDGVAVFDINASVPAGVVVNGANTMRLQLPGDTGADPDTVNLDRYSLTYPRAFTAVNGRLTFTSAGSLFQVTGLPSSNVVVYRQQGGQLVRLTNLAISGSGPYNVRFAGSGAEATYYVAAAGALLTPASMLPALPAAAITGGSAELLIIAHPDFKDGLGALVAARQADGYSVKVVNVEDVYAQFGYSIFDPQAIKDYIAFAAQNLGTTHVLLVGGDTYDYRNFGGSNSISFIPTLYVRTDAYVAFSPADPAFADVTNDGIPDLALGRLPVRTSAELDLVINKTLAYDNKNYGNTAVFSADNTYKQDSENFIAGLVGSWNVDRSYLDDTGTDTTGVAAARQILLNAMNSGVALASYVGHSGEYIWTFEDLFDTYDAAGLTNNNRPMVVTQWGCFNTYFVSPGYDTLGHVFMLTGNQGAAAVLGASTLSYASAEQALGTLMFPNLSQPGMSIGAAMQAAKAGIPDNQRTADIMLGWTILGDPTLVVQP